MSVKLVLEFDNINDMLVAANKLNGGTAEQAKPGKSAKPTESAPTPPAAASSPAPTAAKPKSYADTPLSTMLNDCVKAGKKDAALAILGKYGAKKGPELKAEDFDKVEAEVKALLAAEEALG